MFEKLTYSVTFPSTGRTFAGDIDFQTGFGTITGPNEAGKSLIIEIARWCLFGASALRGKADDYKTLKANLTFTIRGNRYEVKRTHNTANLVGLCTGTKPVNAHIVQLLGFGLEVFDVACAANQGDVERLSSMKPTERKRMVDEVVGLNRLEDLAKWCGDEARVLEKSITPPGEEPQAPAAPMGDLDAARAAYEELHQLQGVLSVKFEKPLLPTCDVKEEAKHLRPVVDVERTIRAEIAMLQKRLVSLPQPSSYSEVDLISFEALWAASGKWNDRVSFEGYHLRPTQTRGALQVMIDDWTVVEQRESLGRLIKELKAHGEVDCPNCEHHFFLESGRLDELERQLETLNGIKTPFLSRREITAQISYHDDWARADVKAEWELLKDAVSVEAPPINRATIDLYRRANAAAQERSEIVQQISDYGEVSDHSADLNTREKFERECQIYTEAYVKHERHEAERAQAQARVQEIEPLAAQFQVLGQLQRDWGLYNERKVQWDCAKTQFDKLTIEADGYRRAQTALNNLRALVKGHLVPALSRVASNLLTQMTGGQRNVISVDADFDVVVDGQPLDTLSGSGKAVANLALRLGLGQVLTNNVLSVFVGDEIDASMDDTRAGNLGECIRTLSSKISQIVLITHKSHGDADWCVNLGNGE